MKTIIFTLWCSFLSLSAQDIFARGFTANKVWFEFLANGYSRVHFSYTVPELREFREAYADFPTKKAAEIFYWSLIRGAHFTFPDAGNIKFRGPENLTPW